MEHHRSVFAEPAAPPQLIRSGDQLIPLPPGVTVVDWETERIRWQNPRIRSFLGCLNLLEEVHESDYTILHCSPERLDEIQRKVSLVAATIRNELAELLDARSVIPDLDQALTAAHLSVSALAGTGLADLNRIIGGEVDEQRLDQRKLLCVVIGHINSFLQDNLVRVLASDPRSQHDTDYFLSKRFTRDIEESEWLHHSVSTFATFLREHDRERPALAAAAQLIRQDEMVPSAEPWRKLARYLHSLSDELSPRLNAVLKLPGIRVDEIEALEQYAVEIPVTSRVILELGTAARKAASQVKRHGGPGRPEREQAVRDLITLHAHFSRRIRQLLETLDQALQGLRVFVPFWLHSLEGRRALILHRPAAKLEPGDTPGDRSAQIADEPSSQSSTNPSASR